MDEPIAARAAARLAADQRQRGAGRADPAAVFAVPAGVLVGFVALPLVALLWRGLASPDFWPSLTKPVVLQALALTALTTALALAVAILTGTPLAYLLARRAFPGRWLVQTVADLPLVLPPMVAGVALLMAFGRRGLLGAQLDLLGIDLPFTTAAVVLAQVFVATPFYVRSARVGFAAVEREVEDAAAIDGATFWQCFRLVTLPLAKPGLASGAVLCLGRALSEFGATLIFAGNFEGRTQTMSLAIMQAMQTDLPAALVLAVLLVLASAAVLVASQAIAGRSQQA